MTTTPDDIQQIVAQIHAAPPQLVLEFAGAGSLGLWWLHSIGGSSRTILEATDRYARAALSDLLGGPPQRAVAIETALAMAGHAYRRARLLAHAERQPHQSALPLLGVACTATIATDYTKRGQHRGVVAVQHATGSTAYALTLTKGLREREDEESLISRLLLHAIARSCGLAGPNLLPTLTSSEVIEEHHQMATDPLARLLRGDVRSVTIYPDGRQVANDAVQGALLSGSFNPLHAGHIRLAEVAASTLGQPALFELPIHNADKGTLIAEEIERRIQQFAGRYPVVLSRAALFTDKAVLFPGCTFVVGYDTALRLVNPRYYGNPDDPTTAERAMHAALGHIQAAHCRFLVAGRVHQGQFQTLADIAIPPAFADLFQAVSEELFRVDLSSSEIRARSE